jgi:hypothetical protein
MAKPLTRENLFKPTKSKRETRAANTDREAKSIIAAETAKRQEKTERLRRLRLAHEQQED